MSHRTYAVGFSLLVGACLGFLPLSPKVVSSPQQVNNNIEEGLQSNVAFRQLGISEGHEVTAAGKLDLTIHTLFWQGGQAPKSPFLARTQIRVEVYGSQDDEEAGDSLVSVNSDVIEVPLYQGDYLYRDEIPFTLPLPPSDTPYRVQLSVWSEDGNTCVCYPYKIRANVL